MLKPALFLASFLLLVSSQGAASSPAQGCHGCSVSQTAQQDFDYAANGGYVVLIVTAGGGYSGTILGEGGVDCFGTHCWTFASFGAVGLAPGTTINECQGADGAKSRDDCKSPAGVTDANGNYSSEESYNIACGAGTKYYSVGAAPLHAELTVTCNACNL